MPPMEPVDLAALRIVKYPDPRLRGPCRPVERFDEDLRTLTRRMFQIMYAAGGVGLAAPQVGLTLRLFVANPTAQPGQEERVYVNPEILSQEGSETNEEGCLSLPGVSSRIKRSTRVRLRAQDLEGNSFEETGEGLLARIFQHETDHINGLTVADRMSAVGRLANRRALKELEEGAQAPPTDPQIR